MFVVIVDYVVAAAVNIYKMMSCKNRVEYRNRRNSFYCLNILNELCMLYNITI